MKERQFRRSNLEQLQLLLICLLVLTANSRKTYLTKFTEAPFVPSLQAYDCTKCVLDNNTGKFCLDQAIDMDWGWEFTQDYDEGDSPAQEYYELKVSLYSEQ